MSSSQRLQVTCPACKAPFMAEIYHIIDVSKQPELKRQLLGGRLNMATCPACKMAGILGMPFAYHDPDKGLLFVFMPAEAGLKADDQQKLIGSLTQEVMMSLPQEKRKGYLLQPRTFLRLESLLDAILEADGITPEMLEEQRERTRLLKELMTAGEDDEKLAALMKDHADELDYEFYATLTATAQSAAEAGDEEFGSALLALRSRLLALQSPGATAAGEGLAAPGEDLEGVTREELLQRLLDAKDEREFEALAAVGRTLIDYTFYLNIANQIETLEKDSRHEEASKLKDVRDRLLNVTERLDQEAEAALKRAGELLTELFKSDEPAKLIEEHLEEIDDLFFYLLTANIEGARQQREEGGDEGNERDERSAATIARLENIASLAADAVERRMPPRLRLVNRLLRAGDDDERERILDDEVGAVDQEFMETLEALITQFSETGQETVASRLTSIRQLAERRLSAAGAAARGA